MSPFQKKFGLWCSGFVTALLVVSLLGWAIQSFTRDGSFFEVTTSIDKILLITWIILFIMDLILNIMIIRPSANWHYFKNKKNIKNIFIVATGVFSAVGFCWSINSIFWLSGIVSTPLEKMVSLIFSALFVLMVLIVTMTKYMGPKEDD